MVLFSQGKGGASAPSASQTKEQTMTDEVKTTPTWGYRKGEDGGLVQKVFDLKEGTKLPQGWVDTPAKCDHAGKEYGE